ncbi:MAG: MarR family transcriptional regulator [Promethearchaeota archaeon]
MKTVLVTELGSSIKLTKSTLLVLDKLDRDGPMSPQDLAESSGLAMRTVTLALKTLLMGKFCRRVPNLMDMRKPLYHADPERVRELRRDADIWRSVAHLRVMR